MGGFTQIRLKDVSEENIKRQNELLKENKVRKELRFYSIEDVKFEYEAFKKGLGVFPEHLFPKDKINSFEDFQKYWNPRALGEVFVPPIGTLQFDCFFGRTSKRAMRGIGRYLGLNPREIKSVDGSFSTFAERGMTRIERQIMTEYNLL